jgi:hypothetical protein
LIDIDKELAGLKTQSFKPSEDLRLNTRAKVNSTARQSGQRKAVRLRPAYGAAVAAVLVVVLLASVFTATPAQAAGYYTIDINPSISVAVDANDNVISVTPKNDDAKALLSGMELKGRQIEEALSTIVQAAARQQYLKSGGHMLVAHFGGDEGLTQQQLDSIVSGQVPGDSVSALMLSGEKQECEKAEKAGQNAGIELLLSNAEEKGIDSNDVGSLIQKLSQSNKEKDKPKDNNGADKDNQAQENTPAPSIENSGNNGKDKDNVSNGNGQGNGGSSNNGGGNSGTPAGTYTITVTGSSGGASATGSPAITLTVN